MGDIYANIARARLSSQTWFVGIAVCSGSILMNGTESFTFHRESDRVPYALVHETFSSHYGIYSFASYVNSVLEFKFFIEIFQIEIIWYKAWHRCNFRNRG